MPFQMYTRRTQRFLYILTDRIMKYNLNNRLLIMIKENNLCKVVAQTHLFLCLSMRSWHLNLETYWWGEMSVGIISHWWDPCLWQLWFHMDEFYRCVLLCKLCTFMLWKIIFQRQMLPTHWIVPNQLKRTSIN